MTGQIEPIVDVRTDFDGKTAERFSIHPGAGWIADDTILFHVKLIDGSDAVYRARFRPSGARLVVQVEFTLAGGIFRFQSENGTDYQLRQTSNLNGSTLVSTTPGNGAELTISFPNPASVTVPTFFYIEPVSP